MKIMGGLERTRMGNSVNCSWGEVRFDWFKKTDLISSGKNLCVGTELQAQNERKHKDGRGVGVQGRGRFLSRVFLKGGPHLPDA